MRPLPSQSFILSHLDTLRAQLIVSKTTIVGTLGLYLLVSLITVGCTKGADSETDLPPSTLCEPSDEACALADADNDGVVNQIDDFPLDSTCSTLSNEDCLDCGVGCPRGLFCQRRVENGVFLGGYCDLAEAESCNSADDDGDGLTDEGPPADNQRGVCGGALKVCSDSLGFVEPEYRAIDGYVDGGELCDGLDNDCDGLVDEAPRAVRSLGVCGGLSQVCVNGAFQEPDYTQINNYSDVELCDGLDNDCDGENDEEIPDVGIGCGAGVGACFEEGITECRPIERRVICSVQGGAPRAEACNGRDDDCDGRTDEQLPNTGQACTSGQGICAVDGTLICADETGILTCDATPNLPEVEACNGADDDCDGVIDEESMGAGEGCRVGVGACSRFGVYECDFASHELVCSQTPSEPVIEVCNGVDDDCDGRTDEEIPTVGEGCSIGEGRCFSSGVFTCDPGLAEVICDAPERAPAAESCNNVDDDCDGEVDEEALGTEEECVVGEGFCGRTALYRCDSERQELVCDAVAGEGEEERCNTVDDDCDGIADEGDIIRIGEHGMEWVCVAGGDYLMGWNTRVNERPIHPVAVPTFELSRTEVTVSQYGQCIQGNQCGVPILSESNWNIPGRFDHPINAVSWDEAIIFATWAGARLPTEAEWEYASRGRGTEARYPWGEETPSCDLAVYQDTELGRGCGSDSTEPVCSRIEGVSALGLCDLSGNVWEWTADGYSPDYTGTPNDGSASQGTVASKVLRGGGWRDTAETLTTTYRLQQSPSVRQNHIGIRVARTVTPED